MADLLSCPFCGSSASFHKHGNHGIGVECTNYSCTLNNAYENETEAITAWNARASGWLPIESAPKDGTTVLLANIHGERLYWAEASRYSPKAFGWYSPTGSATKVATHWQHLPEPPK